MSKRTLHISDRLRLPLDLAAETSTILGVRGGGKTNTAGTLVEEMLDVGQPVAIIDPTDVWWGLRSSKDGNGDGYSVIVFGGPHGDVPLEEAGGKVLAEFVVNERVPVILSLRHLRKGAQRRFVREFCEEIYHLKGKPEFRQPLTVVIDEAPLFIPQKVMGEAAFVVGAVEDLIARGRASGFGVVLIGQRSATINKDVLSQSDTIISHRLTAPQDKAALKAWFEDNASIEELEEVLKSLATLQTGEAWVWASKLGIFERAQIRERRTFDSSASPKLGQRVVKPKRLAAIDLDKLKGRMAAVVEKAKADDPKVLRARIVELEREAAKAQSAKPAKPQAAVEVKRVEVPAVKAKDIQSIERAAATVDAASKRIADAISKATPSITQTQLKIEGIVTDLKLLERGEAAFASCKPAPIIRSNIRSKLPMRSSIVPATPRDGPDAVHTTAKPGRKEPRPNAGVDGDVKITAASQRILDALAWWESIGVHEPANAQLGAVAGIDTTGGYFSNLAGPLTTAGLITRGGGRIALTDAGRAVANVPAEAPTIAQHHDSLRERVRKMKSANGRTLDILNLLIDRAGEELSNEEVGTACSMDHTGGYFSNSIGPLSTLSLIERRNGMVRPTSLLFPEGLA